MEYVPLKAKRAVHMNCILVDKVISYGHMGLTTILNPFYMYTEIEQLKKWKGVGGVRFLNVGAGGYR